MTESDASSRVWLIHGFHATHGGKHTVDKLKPYTQQASSDILDYDYGWRGLIGVRLNNDETAKKIAEESRSGDIAIGYSNGAAILHAASRLGANLSGLVYINPALDNDKVPGAGVEWCHVWHSPTDMAAWWASWLPCHEWGDMGRVGFQGDDSRVSNLNIDEYCDCEAGHGGFFDRLEQLGKLVVNKIPASATEASA
jgi:hypothetical protein